MHLKEHGCKDITSALDISKCSEYPVSNGGSGNIYRGFLHDGTKVGIKCLKLQLNSIGNTEKHIKVSRRPWQNEVTLTSPTARCKRTIHLVKMQTSKHRPIDWDG
jgi:hypothetical protein